MVDAFALIGFACVVASGCLFIGCAAISLEEWWTTRRKRRGRARSRAQQLDVALREIRSLPETPRGRRR